MNEGCLELKPTSCEQHYQQLLSKCRSILDLSFSTQSSHSDNHNYASDLEQWVKILSQRPEAFLLKCALREYQHALLAVVQGQYRYAYAALRLFFELSLRSVYFSAHGLELRLWLKGEQDIKWESLVGEDTGVFSKTFVGAYNEALAEEARDYNGIARLLYRECSEFVHGNAHTYESLPEKLEFREEVFLDWQEKAHTARLTVTFALCARYLAFLGKTDLAELESTIIDELGHIPAIRVFFDKAAE